MDCFSVVLDFVGENPVTADDWWAFEPLPVDLDPLCEPRFICHSRFPGPLPQGILGYEVQLCLREKLQEKHFVKPVECVTGGEGGIRTPDTR